MAGEEESGAVCKPRAAVGSEGRVRGGSNILPSRRGKAGLVAKLTPTGVFRELGRQCKQIKGVIVSGIMGNILRSPTEPRPSRPSPEAHTSPRVTLPPLPQRSLALPLPPTLPPRPSPKSQHPFRSLSTRLHQASSSAAPLGDGPGGGGAKGEEEDLINGMLHDECLDTIFNHLRSLVDRNACSLVCRRWLRVENLSRSKLRVRACRPTPDIARLAARYTALTSVDLSSTAGSVVDSDVEALAHHCKGLLSLNMTHCPMVTDCGLSALAGACTRLRSLEMARCKSITDVGVSALLKACGRSIVELSLALCPLVSDISLKVVGKYCANLARLDLRGCDGVTDLALCGIASGCPQLRSLDLRGCDGISNKGLIAIAKGCKRLLTLNLAVYSCDIDDSSMRALGASCPHLQALNVSECHTISDIGVEAIARGCRSMVCLRFSYCRRITDLGLKAVAEGCQSLLSLELIGCDGITNASLNFVGAKCHSLQVLHMSHCHDITDEGLGSIVRGCPNLQWLELRHCPGLTDRSLFTITKHCQNLKALTLIHCDGITSSGLAAIRGRYGNPLYPLVI